MAIASLRRRVLRLEGTQRSAEGATGVQGGNLESALRNAAFQHLSIPELRILRDIAAAVQNGSFLRDELTAEQHAAINAFEVAFDEECRKAGFATRADYDRRCKAS